jgi:hypothetical protein
MEKKADSRQQTAESSERLVGVGSHLSEVFTAFCFLLSAFWVLELPWVHRSLPEVVPEP